MCGAAGGKSKRGNEFRKLHWDYIFELHKK